MMELTFLKELMLIRQANQKSVIFVTIGTSQIRGFKFQPDVNNGYHDVLLMSMNLNNISILNIPGADYHCIISGISKSETKEIIQKIDLTEKSRTL